jgi:uncharacterized membrane protein
MSQILTSISTGLHAFATVVFIGHFVLLAVIYLPALSKNGSALSEISKRSRPWMYGSLIVFMITGTHLMLIDSGYLGFMDFGNFWGIVMLIKHVLVLAMIGLGFWYNAVLRVGPLMSSNNPEQAILGFKKYVNAMAICGALVLLLTALAQVQ